MVYTIAGATDRFSMSDFIAPRPVESFQPDDTHTTRLPAGWICGDVEVRNPFQSIQLPSLCRQYVKLYYHTNRSGFTGAFKVLIRETILGFERRYRGGIRGVLSLSIDGAEHRFSFNPLNTQFHSVYAPHHANGYEPETAVLIDLLLPQKGVFFDVGANWGHFSLYAASQKGFAGQIHSFEPMPSTFKDLVASIKETGLERVITAHNLALSDSAGGARMIIPDGVHSGLAMISSESAGIPMHLARLDALDLPKPDLIKIDVEGHEAAMIRGAAATISASRPMILFESAARGPLEDIFNPFFELDRLGYQFFVPSFVRTEGGFRYLVGYGDSQNIKGPASLALVPCDPTTRFLMTGQFNVLACHATRIADLSHAIRVP